MDSRLSLLVLFIGISGSLALHIVMSPDEAEKIMKRDSAFSEGLAGFVDNKLADGSQAKTKKDKIIELKRLVTNALQGLKKAKKYDAENQKVSVEIKRQSPPALPLDVKSEDMSSLEKLVDSLISEKNQKRGCYNGNCYTNYGKEVEVPEKEAAGGLSSESADEVDKILQSVKRLVKTQALRDGEAPSKAKKSPVPPPPSSENIISDSGDVGDKMLAKVKDLIKKAAGGKNGKIFIESKRKASADATKLEANVEKLLRRISQLTKKEASPDVGDITLKAVRDMAAKRQASNQGQTPKASSEGGKVKDEVSLSDIKNEINELLSKIEPSKDASKPAKEVEHEDVAVESEAVEKAGKVDKRREMIVDLLKTYDEMTKKSAKHDTYASELENASRSLGSGKVSKQTEASIRGFDTEAGTKRRSHPK